MLNTRLTDFGQSEVESEWFIRLPHGSALVDALCWEVLELSFLSGALWA